MADYSSWKVADLKAELKRRGISQTGLRLKQHFIDKLAEEDTQAPTGDAAKASPEAAAAEEEEQEQQQQQQQQQQEAASDVAQPAAETEPQPHEEKEAPSQEPPAPKEPSPEEPEPAKTQDEPLEKPATAEDDAQKVEPVQKPESAVGQEKPGEAEPEPAPAPAGVAPSQAEPAERAESAEAGDKRVPPAASASAANTEMSTPVPVEEALEDKRKRKRRSQSPVPTQEAIANKKARAKEEVVLKDDVMNDAPLEEQKPEEEKPEEEKPEEQKPSVPLPTSAPKPPTSIKQDARFRGLFKSTEEVPPTDTVMDDTEVEPALHAVTTALYIDGLMRPLQPVALRKHIVGIASGAGASPNADIVQEFYLDPIKTHCFVRLSDTTAASRVRSAMHGKVWPKERNRKVLFADFVPDDKIEEWIKTERESRDRAGPPVRWEVRYDTTDEETTATLTEVGPNSRSAPNKPKESPFSSTPPLGPRGSVQADRRPSNAPPVPPSRPGQGFKPLDELFKSTTAKPKLYYQPVSRSVADKRLDQFDELLRKGTFPRRGGDERRRITFEDDDYFVDIGPEYGRAALQRRQDRGGRPGGSWRGRRY
ncbi:DNA-binding SAP [Penicillium argentinense]|uniref:DNA-binding SAP n=1 Tax=Penicillium argentinense TaxID=1131581 RepID=A0A9W9FH09_9EURO|nr:DNA-binding SAP [Penicillium argentinense]KAJ5099832.1 DNA-binding SAP [Penicillium argentinense]